MLALILSLAPASAAGARATTVALGAKASPWTDFQEGRVRLLMIEPAMDDQIIRGGIGIRLMPGYKTYWRNPGDSGLPPTFDFAGSRGAQDFNVEFPMPSVFDDGGGGQAWGYKTDVLLPFTARKTGTGPVSIVLKLDFAVCGTTCIPLSADLKLEGGLPAGLEAIEAIGRAESRVPKRLAPADFAAQVRLDSRIPGDNPGFVLEIRHPAAPEDFAVFTESRGYLLVKPPVLLSPGHYRVELKGQLPPGADKSFGPVRLTFGSKKEPREGMLHLDGAGVTQ